MNYTHRDAFENKLKKRKFIRKITASMMIGIIALIVTGVLTFRFDPAGGNHKIIPTAVDTDIWGNHQVYFRTSALTQNQEEDFYYVRKGDTEIVDIINNAILEDQTIVVYYERYIGFKGINAPSSSPITKVEIVGENK